MNDYNKQYHDVQHIRRSQFVLTFGPGSIIETRDGPRVIPAIDIGLGLYYSDDLLKSLELTDERLKLAINFYIKNYINEDVPVAHVFQLPTNAWLGKGGFDSIYKTKKFPEWKICSKHNILFKGDKCPLCKSNEESDENSTAVRFVMACINGHLDDVDWHYAVHKDTQHQNCKPPYYKWEIKGSTLSDIIVECPTCGSKKRMNEIYSLDFKCTGRLPEKENSASGVFYKGSNKSDSCDLKMKVIQRQSSSLRIPETITLLGLPTSEDIDKNLKDFCLSNSNFIKYLKDHKEWEPNQIRAELCKYLSSTSQEIKEKICSDDSKDKSLDLIEKIFTICENTSIKDKTFIDLIYEEFEFLIDAASKGSKLSDVFSIDPPIKISDVEINDMKLNFEIYPVEILKTYTAQIGYRRYPYTTSNEESLSGKIISVGVSDTSNQKWYPGFENTGEGLLITLENFSVPKISDLKAFQEWSRYKNNLDYNDQWKEMRENPYFVWFHTLSHVLLKKISIYAGYSIGSLRERVYIDRKSTKGGILIYTAMVGGDSSMGGLSDLCSQEDLFRDIIYEVIDGIKFCSNDPLCGEVRKTNKNVNGSACHSCLLISETSCEHRNMFLDRHIVLGD